MKVLIIELILDGRLIMIAALKNIKLLLRLLARNFINQSVLLCYPS